MFTYVFIVTLCTMTGCEELEIDAGISGDDCLAYAETYAADDRIISRAIGMDLSGGFGSCQVDTVPAHLRK